MTHILRHFSLLATLLLLSGCSNSGAPKDIASDHGPTDDSKAAEVRGDLLDVELADVVGAKDTPALPDANSDLPDLSPVDLLATPDLQGIADIDDLIDELLLKDLVADGSADSADLSPVDIKPPPPLEEVWPIGEVQETCEGGLLATLDTPSGPIRILVLRGSHHQMGRQSGCLIGSGTGQFMSTLLAYFTAAIQEEAANMGLAPEQTTTLLISMLNNIWLHMEPYVDQRFLDEFQGFEEMVMGDPEIAQHWTETKPDWALRAFVLLSNLSDLNWGGTIEDILDKLVVGASDQLLEHYAGDEIALLMRNVADKVSESPMRLPMRTTCSFFAAWGPRTVDGHLLASRNLDWSTDTGIAQMKGITFFAPTGGTVHASIGYLGFFGSLAGISHNGIVLSEVGSESTMERLTGQPWTLKFREVLEDAENLDEAVALLAGVTQDGAVRPPTIGYNWMVGYGDPTGGGANAAAAAVENNGVVAGIMRGATNCSQETQVIQYAEDGTVLDVMDNTSAPELANLEQETLEIDGAGEPRLFQLDQEGKLLLNNNGCPIIASDGTGIPWAVGRPLDCALFRGDEALVHAVRRWQTASNGPQNGDKLLCDSGSYRHRYMVMHDILEAYEKGSGYIHNGENWVEETGSQIPVGLQQAEMIARAAAMGSNVMSIAYDATALSLRVSYEIGTGPDWQGAHLHDYHELELGPAFELLTELPLDEGK
jgi:hypothetical protein